jgi:hypothetical protein
MKRFVIGFGDNNFITLNADCIDYTSDRIGFIINHHLVAEFNNWEFWYEETVQEKKENCCCPCK